MPRIINNKVLLTQDEERQIEDDVNFLLDNAGIKKPPIPILNIVQSAIPHSKVSFLKNAPENIKGITFLGNGICDILINENDPEVVKRFTTAHELGHALRKESGCSLNKNVLLRSEFQERRADYWAACLLIPRWMIEVYWSLAPSIDMSDIERIRSRVAKLALIFEVSRSSMIIQLKDIGLIPVETYFQLYKPYRNWTVWIRPTSLRLAEKYAAR